jgi:hypothetical protein
MSKFYFIICLIISVLSLNVQAQTSDDSFSCGTDAHHAWLMQSNPEYKSAFQRQKAILDSLKYAPTPESRQSPPVYTIPIVVHVIHLGEQVGQQTNISDQQILDAIVGLNERYANANGAGTDIEINFCLATIDPNGCPTSGILRADGSVIPGYREGGVTWDGTCGVDEVLVKDLSKWPTWDYYNIWVVHDICGSIAGYAYYPNGNEYDGTVIDIASMRYENSTLAHELGHGLNLKHTFSGDEGNSCPPDNDCLEDGDEICDTPPHRTNSCGNNNPCSNEGEWLNSRHNWMSYCFPAQEDGKFTPDQRTRMRNTMLVNPRAALLQSEGCANAERMQITNDDAPMCRNESRLLTAQPAGGHFEIVSGSGVIQNNVLTVTGGTEITIAYKIDLEFCTSEVTQYIIVRPAPNSLLRSDEDSLCIGQATMLEGFPAGGTYSVVDGPAMLDSSMVTALDEGNITLLYEKEYAGCTLRDTHEIVSFEVPVAEIEQLADQILAVTQDAESFQWVNCDDTFEPIPGETGDFIQVTSSGSYAVVSSNGICKDTSDCIIVEITSSEDPGTVGAIRVFPNPVNDVCYLVGVEDVEKYIITLMDIHGKILTRTFTQTKGTITFPMADYKPGVYLIHLQGEGVMPASFRIVKL